jgi:hypothetical protein
MSEQPEVAISVDGKVVAAREGELLLDAVLRCTDIPHVCYHSPSYGNRRWSDERSGRSLESTIDR